MDELTLLRQIFDTATTTPLGEKITTFMVAWYFVRKTIKGHFSAIETALKNINLSVGELKTAMTNVETAHAARLQKLETEVEDLKKEK